VLFFNVIEGFSASVLNVFLHQKIEVMPKQRISFSEPNDEWLNSQIDNDECSSKSERVHDLIRQARNQQAQIDWVRAKLEKSVGSGFTSETKEQILEQSKALLNGWISIE
jgi:antitoxin ParD1/3/4